MKVLDAQSIQQWEAQTIADGVRVEALMECAVEGLHSFITARFPPGRALVLCGKGHNGNDALWLAGRLAQSGWSVTAWSSHPSGQRRCVDAASVGLAMEKAVIFPATPESVFATAEPVLIIDGLLGLGAKGPPREPFASMLKFVAQQRRGGDAALAIDIPSGVDADNGRVEDPHFTADWTVAIGAVKRGCLRPAAEFAAATVHAVGRLAAVPIPLEPKLAPASGASGPGEEFFTLADARRLINSAEAATHKTKQGRVGVWAGSPGMCGAAILASRAALRSGAGLVRLFSAPECVPLLMTASPEVMVAPVHDADVLHPSLNQCDAICAGPGIGTAPETAQWLRGLIEQRPAALVLDADALNLCGPGRIELSSLPSGTILTPHPGEFARLMPHAPGDRGEAAALFASLHPGIILCLKGPNTLVTAHGEVLSFNGSGNPGMATAGSGDVLAGLIAGLRASGMPPFEAARLGVFWHGLAGDLAAARHSEASTTAGDLVAALGAARMVMGRP